MIEVRDLLFAYRQDGFRLRVDSLDIASGERVAMIGPSGSGKSTLLHLMGGILTPQAGAIRVQEQQLNALSEPARRDYRIQNIGLVFQEFELIEYLTVLDNLLLPFRLNRTLLLNDAARERARRLAAELGITDKLCRYPGCLSQGERQRVAIGRALVTEPNLLLADEPTGNLDPRNKQRILDLLLQQAELRDLTLIMVTHDHGLLERFQRVIDVDVFHFEAAHGQGP